MIHHRGFQTRIAAECAVVLACGLWAAAAGAGILHPGDDPYTGDTPPDAVVGRWGPNASCVAIGERHVVTTAHQGGGIGTDVVLGGTTYDAADIFTHSKADLRVVLIEAAGGGPAALTDWVGVYTGTDEVTQTGVFGGFGKRRGSTLTDGDGAPYAYAWTGAANDTLTWGRQRIDGTGVITGSYTMAVLGADFDADLAPEDPGNGRHYVEGEIGIADFDSGGGLLLEMGDGWEVAGLGRGVERKNESRFRSPVTGNLDPDSMDFVRLSSYATWIAEVLGRTEWTLDGNGTWSEGGNWDPAAAPDGQDKWAVFGTAATAPVVVTLDAAATVGSIRFEGIQAYTIAGSETLSLGVGIDDAVIEAVNYAGVAGHTVSTALDLEDSLLVNVVGGNSVLLDGTIGGAAGAGLRKGGSGTATLATDNTFDGGTRIEGGTLRVTAAAGLGTGPVEMLAGTLALLADAPTSFGNDLSLVEDATVRVDRNTAAGVGGTHSLGSIIMTTAELTAVGAHGYELAFTGSAQLGVASIDETAIDTASADVMLAGETGIRGKLTKEGPGTLTLAGPQSHHHSAQLWVNGGTLALDTNAGTPATADDPAEAGLEIWVMGSKVVLGADQDLGRLAVVAPADGLQEVDLNGRVVRIYDTSVESGLAAMIAMANGGTATGGDGIYDSQAAPDERIGYTDQRIDAHGDPYVALRAVFAGDVTMDGQVGDADFAALLGGWGQSGTWDTGDLSYNRQVGDEDFSILLGNWGKTGGHHVPEPATLALVLTGLGVAAARRRR